MAVPENVNISINIATVGTGHSIAMTLTPENPEVQIDNSNHTITFSPTEQDQEYDITFTIVTNDVFFGNDPIIFPLTPGQTNPDTVIPRSQAQVLLKNIDSVPPGGEPQVISFRFQFNIGEILIVVDPTIVNNPPPGTSDDEETS